MSPLIKAISTQGKTLVACILLLTTVATQADAILYFADYSPTETIYTVNENGSGLTNLGVNGPGAPNIDSLGLDLANNHIYYTANFGNSVYRVNTDGTNAITVFTVAGSPNLEHVEVDTVNNKLYWTQRSETAGLYRSDLDGSNASYLTASGIREVRVDNVNNRVYYTNGSRVYSSNLDGSDETILYTGGAPWGIAVDPIGGKLYWTDRINNGGGHIRSSDLDGSNAQIIVNESTSTVFDSRSIMVDRTTSKIFWTNSAFTGGTPSLASADLDGSNPQLVLSGSGLNFPQGIGQPAIIPEPSTYGLFFSVLAIFIGIWLKKRRSHELRPRENLVRSLSSSRR